MKRNLIFCFVIFFFIESSSQENTTKYLQKIQKLRTQSSDENKSLKERLIFAQQAYDLSKNLGVDSTILLSSRKLQYIHLISGNYQISKEIANENTKLATKLRDTISLAFANFNLGYLYMINHQNDSSYYHYRISIEQFNSLNRKEEQISALINLASILTSEKDYAGSDELLIEASKLIENINYNEQTKDNKWIIFDNLATNSLHLNELEKSLEYHRIAIDIAKSMTDGYYNLMLSYNNIAFTYRKLGDFEMALEYYERVRSEKFIFEIDPSLYPLILENIAYTKYLSGDQKYSELESLFQEGFQISDSLDDPYVKLAVSVNMAKFYYGTQKTDSALKYANVSYKLARGIQENDILLESMMLMSKLNEGEISLKYLNEHIALTDSILQKERSARNKFARIKFDTDLIEQENEKITQQRQWLLGISAALLLTAILVYIIITQRAKNKELRFVQDQQKANEEIYNLMLQQQDKVEEARANEKKRISQEIHDGVLGKMFGVRLSLDSLNFSSGPDAIKNRSTYLDELKTIEQEIRQISHDLNTDFVSGSSFRDILQDLIEKQTMAYGLDYNFDHDDEIEWETMTNKTKINVYRILQESLQNIYKHAEASIVNIGLFLKNNVISLSIADDGKGFDTSKNKKGIGIKNITSRAHEINGDVQFKSEPDNGTEVVIKVPYNTN